MLPLLNLKLGDSTGVPLVGVERNGVFTLADSTDDTSVQRLLGSVPNAEDIPTTGAARILAFADAMETDGRTSLSKMKPIARQWRESYATAMTYKREMYREKKQEVQSKVSEAKDFVDKYINEARGGSPQIADIKTPNWDISKDVSSQWLAYVKESSAMDKLANAAHTQVSLIEDNSTSRNWASLMNDLAVSLKELVELYKTALPLLMESVADLVYAFCNEPLVTNAAFLNWVLLGNPGVGKTELAKKLGSVLGALGVLIYKDHIECGRSHFVAEYEGQTALKTRTFLVSNLEKVVFLDEAYSLTTWETKAGQEERKLSAYSGEAVTELVAFLSEHVGQVSFMVAGYEVEMLRDFMPSNQGLNRRFPYKIWMDDYEVPQLVDIYLAKLGKALTEKDARKELNKDDTRPYFTEKALQFFSDIISGSRASEVDTTNISKLFKAQGGAMANMANMTALLISASTYKTQSNKREIGLNNGGQAWGVTFPDMYNILATVAQNEFGPRASVAIREMQNIAKHRGWINDKQEWQIPSSPDSLLKRSASQSNAGSTPKAPRVKAPGVEDMAD